MTTNNQIRFIIFHTEAGQTVTDLDALVSHADHLVSEDLVYLLMDFTSKLKSNGYDFKLWKAGDDQ